MAPDEQGEEICSPCLKNIKNLKLKKCPSFVTLHFSQYDLLVQQMSATTLLKGVATS